MCSFFLFIREVVYVCDINLMFNKVMLEFILRWEYWCYKSETILSKQWSYFIKSLKSEIRCIIIQMLFHFKEQSMKKRAGEYKKNLSGKLQYNSYGQRGTVLFFTNINILKIKGEQDE